MFLVPPGPYIFILLSCACFLAFPVENISRMRMVVSRASGTLMASSLKQNTFSTLEEHPGGKLGMLFRRGGPPTWGPPLPYVASSRVFVVVDGVWVAKYVSDHPTLQVRG